MKTKSVTKPEERLVNHLELQTLIRHVAAINAALEVRLTECERVLAVNPEVGELAADFLKRIKGEMGEVRTLVLMGNDEKKSDVVDHQPAIGEVESPETAQSIKPIPSSDRDL